MPQRYGAGRVVRIGPLAGSFYIVDRPAEGRFLECLNPVAIERAFPLREDDLTPIGTLWPKIQWRHGVSRSLGTQAIAEPFSSDVGVIWVRLLDFPGVDRIARAIDAGRIGASLGFTPEPGGVERIPGVRSRMNPAGLPAAIIDRCIVHEVSLTSTPNNKRTKATWSPAHKEAAARYAL